MTKNPFINALAAAAYIAVVASIMFYGPELIGPIESIILPIALLSLFVLSVAVMSFIFFYQPFRLYFDGEKAGALRLFLFTLGSFALITIALFVIAAVVR